MDPCFGSSRIRDPSKDSGSYLRIQKTNISYGPQYGPLIWTPIHTNYIPRTKWVRTSPGINEAKQPKIVGHWLSRQAYRHKTLDPQHHHIIESQERTLKTHPQSRAVMLS